MASQVPYTGTEDISPQTDPLSQVHVDTPIAAFGGTVAQAVEHLGDVTQSAGKELFARGLAFQELDNQFKADQAAADLMDEHTGIYLNYSKLKGEDLVAGNKKYVQDLEDARQKKADELDNPDAKKRFLADSRKPQSQMIWHGGILARQGQDEAANIAAGSKVSAAVTRFSTLDPNDKATWDSTVSTIRQAEEDKLHLKGGPTPGSPEAKAASAPNVSAAVSQLILSKINSDHPERSKVFAKQALADGTLLPEDYDKLEWKMDNAIDGKLGRKIGSQAGADSVGKNVKEIVKAARDQSEKTDPGNKTLSDNAADAALSRHDHEEALQTTSYRQTLQTLRRKIDGTDSPDGKVPISLEEALQDPNFRRTYNDSPDAVQGQVRELIRKNQSTDGYIPNEKGTADFNHLYATLKDPRSSADEVDQALNTDIMKTSMTREQRFVIGNLQDQTLAKQSSPAGISSALHVPSVQLAMQNAGIYKGTAEYSEFVTKFTQAVENYAEGGHRTVKDNEQLGKIANSMLMQQAGKHFWNFSSDPMYKDPFAANPGLKAQALREYKDMYHRDPTEEELNQMSGAMYNKYFQTLGNQSRPAQPKSTNRVTLKSGS